MSEDFDLDVTNTAGSWYGTQMKPEIFEPFTAEWGGRVAKNAGWLFARQQQHIFSRSENSHFIYPWTSDHFHKIFSQRFWLPEVVGTLKYGFYLQFIDNGLGDANLLVVNATLWNGYGNGYSWLGATEATYTTDGDKVLTLTFDPNWSHGNIRKYAWLRVYAYISGEGQAEEWEVRMQRFRCWAEPRT